MNKPKPNDSAQTAQPAPSVPDADLQNEETDSNEDPSNAQGDEAGEAT